MNRIDFDPYALKSYFSDKVREYCRSCKRYGKNTNCPPNLDSVSYYKHLLTQFKYGFLVYNRYEIHDISNWKELGAYSSKEVQKELFTLRDQLLYSGKFPLVFGAGSCKNCESCTIPCRSPESSIIPLEGTGLNVVEFFEQITNIKLEFPVKDFFYRVGIIVWD